MRWCVVMCLCRLNVNEYMLLALYCSFDSGLLQVTQNPNQQRFVEGANRTIWLEYNVGLLKTRAVVETHAKIMPVATTWADKPPAGIKAREAQQQS
jgi:hypothetical protein